MIDYPLGTGSQINVLHTFDVPTSADSAERDTARMTRRQACLPREFCDCVPVDMKAEGASFRGRDIGDGLLVVVASFSKLRCRAPGDGSLEAVEVVG
jgi:hypothetical protein